MPTVAERAHHNLTGFVRLQGRLNRAEVLDEPGIVAFRAERDFPALRMATTGKQPLAPEAFADRVEEFLLGAGSTAAVMIRPADERATGDALIARGFAEYSQAPEMVCEGRLDKVPAPEGVTVRLAATADDVRAYAQIAGHAFRHLSIPEDVTRTTLDNPEVMLAPEVVIALAEIDGRPVAAASSLIVEGSGDGYVGWVACLDDARGRGLGDVVTRRVTNEAFDRGATVVTLEASRFGESTYTRMGYREIYRYATLITF